MVKSFGRDIPLEHFDIAFDHVSFGYDDRQVLHDVSFTIPAGKSFGILGGTGSGKSSLLLLLCRLYAPSEGRVTVGGADLAHAVGKRAKLAAVGVTDVQMRRLLKL